MEMARVETHEDATFERRAATHMASWSLLIQRAMILALFEWLLFGGLEPLIEPVENYLMPL